MYYSSICLLALIHHLIINYEILKTGKNRTSSDPHFRYGQYLCALFLFYMSDFLWGFSESSGILALAYADTVLFFASMALSVLLWTRYVVTFLDKHGKKAKALLAAGWAIFAFVIIHLIINCFRPCVFTFTEDGRYIPMLGRYILFVAQLIMFLMLFVYSFFVYRMSEGRKKIHYMAVCVSSGVMAALTVLQSFDAYFPYYTVGCFIANCLIHVFAEEDEKKERSRLTEKVQQEREIYSQISASLAEEYAAIFYIDIETGKYVEISISEKYKSLNIPKSGNDYYLETRENIHRFVHPDDRAFAESMYYKDTMKKNIEGRGSYSYKYRIMVGDEARYFRFDVMLSADGEHFVLCDKDIQDTITAETALLEKQKASITFTQIAESLASNYDVIYYVDMETGEYSGFTSNNIYGELKVDESGNDFFSEAQKNAALLLHPDDRAQTLSVLNKDHLLTSLERKKQFVHQYRLVVNGQTQHTRFSGRKSSDGRHMIICVENIENEVRKEAEHLRALNTEKELARRDELTGIRNKTAFTELKQSIQNNIEKGMDYLPFAIAVCDLNGLKKINDTEGHNAGDEYIKASATLLCEIFAHSPVFRVGGDEFAIFLRGEDYSAREELTQLVRQHALANREKNSGPVIAVGLAEYDPSGDSDVNEIFNRADRLMYEDKRELKGIS